MRKLKWHISFVVLLVLLLSVTVYADDQKGATAWVTASLYKDGSILFDGATSATMTAEVPYFDLNQYDLEEYILTDEEGNAVEKPTLLHGIIYLIEKYALQGEDEKVGTGYYKDEIFQKKMTGNLRYYKEDGSTEAVTPSGGTMLALDENGAVKSLWGFDDVEIRLYLNQKQQRKKIQEVLLEDLNIIEFMLLSKDEDSDILYPRFWNNTYQIKVGESVDMYASFYNIYGKAYSWNGGTALYMVRHMNDLEKLDIDIDTSSGIGKWTVGPFQHVGIYRAKAIFYPFYYKQLIEVRDSITEISLNNGAERHYSVSKKALSEEKTEIIVSPDEFYDIAENAKVILDDVGGKVISREMRNDGDLAIVVSYSKASEESKGDKEESDSEGNLNGTDNGIGGKPEEGGKNETGENQGDKDKEFQISQPDGNDTSNKPTTSVLSQTKATKTSLTVTWAPKTSATAGYRIYIKGGKYKKFTKVADVAAGKTSYTVKKAAKKQLTAGTQYEIKIVSLKKSGSKKVEKETQKLKAVTLTVAPTFTSAKRSKNSKAITLKWKKASGASGYVIQISTKAKSGFKTIKIVSTKTKSFTRKNLKKTNTYYFRMRTYKTVNGKKFYSSWSKVKKVK